MRAIGSWLQWATSKATRPPSWTSPILACVVILGAIAWMNVRSELMPERRFDGFNVIATPRIRSAARRQSWRLPTPNSSAPRAVAIIPFLWQPSPASPDLVRGKDMNDDELRAAIRDAHALGLAVLVKPHVWVPQSWAGAIVMHSDSGLAAMVRELSARIRRISHRLPRRKKPKRWRSAPNFANHAAAGMERPDRQDARRFFRPLALCGAQCRGSRNSSVLGPARRHRRFALSAARRRRRSRLSPRRDARDRRSPRYACGAIYRKPVVVAEIGLALGRRRGGKAVGKRGRTRGGARSGASGRRARRLA